MARSGVVSKFQPIILIPLKLRVILKVSIGEIGRWKKGIDGRMVFQDLLKSKEEKNFSFWTFLRAEKGIRTLYLRLGKAILYH
jgi:hypothetical protein